MPPFASMDDMLEAEVGVILSVPLRYPVIGPLRDFPELASSPVTIAIQEKSCRVRKRSRRQRSKRRRRKRRRRSKEEVDYKSMSKAHKANNASS